MNLGPLFVKQNIIFLDIFWQNKPWRRFNHLSIVDLNYHNILPIPHWRVFVKFRPTKNDSLFTFSFSQVITYFFSQNELHYRIPKSLPTQLSQCIKLHLNICLSAIWNTVTCTHPWFSKLDKVFKMKILELIFFKIFFAHL